MNKKFFVKTLRVEAADYIRSKILEGNMEPGDRVNEFELSEEMGISRGPIREALRQLEQEGLVTYVPNKGCSVAKLTVGDMYEMYLIRSDLENLAIEVCGGHFSEETISRMEELVNEIEAAAGEENLCKVVEADQKFHEEIVKAAKLPKLLRIWHAMDGANVSVYFTIRALKIINWKTLGKNHQILLDAAKKGDKEYMKEQMSFHYISVPDYAEKHT